MNLMMVRRHNKPKTFKPQAMAANFDKIRPKAVGNTKYGDTKP